MLRGIATAAALLTGLLVFTPGTLGAASTQIEVGLTIPQTGNITVATAHARAQKRGGQVKTILKKGQRLPSGVSLYARPTQKGTTITVDLILTRNASVGSRAHASARRVAVLTAPNDSGFKRSFDADEQANVYELGEGSKPSGKFCNGKGAHGSSRLIAGKHVFNSTDAGQVVKDACSAIDASRSGGAKKLQDELQG